MLLPYRVQLNSAPKARRHGEPYAFVPPKWIRDQHEIALTLAWICHRKLWGQTYAALQPDFFWDMPHDSGVLLRPTVTTSKVAPGAVLPGDIDLLVIPYHGNELVLERTLAIEIKAIRASFAKQGKSPNDFGYSQAGALSALGFPYVALVHLIVSDGSPEHAWRTMGRAEIVDGNTGRARILPDALHDMLPSDLMDRAFGRLVANSQNRDHGLGAVYLEKWSEELGRFDMNGFWFPNCRQAQANEAVSRELLNNVGAYYKRNAQSFLATPSHDPIWAAVRLTNTNPGSFRRRPESMSVVRPEHPALGAVTAWIPAGACPRARSDPGVGMTSRVSWPQCPTPKILIPVPNRLPYPPPIPAIHAVPTKHRAGGLAAGVARRRRGC